MTVPADTEDATDKRPETAPDAHPDPGPLIGPTTSARDVVSGTCPYLTSSGGSWRMAGPSRDHRCGAVEAAAPQTTEKQRRHCLSPDHVECPTFRAARSARTSTLAAGADPELIAAADRHRRPLARTAPILLESPRLVERAVRFQFDRAPGQLALVALMVVAFAIVALTRFSSGGPTASSSPAPSAASLSPGPTSHPTPVPSASGGPSPSASAGPLPSARTTYTVKARDTLLGIASHFGTTAAQIKQLNGLTSNSLKIGQVLKIP